MMLKLFRVGSAEPVNAASLCVDPAKNMPDNAVLAGGIHALKYHEQASTAGCEQSILGSLERRSVILERFESLNLFAEFVTRLGRDLGELDRVPFFDTEFFWIETMIGHGFCFLC
jgi:hypothetical protein